MGSFFCRHTHFDLCSQAFKGSRQHYVHHVFSRLVGLHHDPFQAGVHKVFSVRHLNRTVRFQFGHFRRRVVRYQIKVVRSAIQIEVARSHSTLYRIYFMIQRFRRRGRRTCGESIDTESLSIRHIRCRVGTGRSLVRLRPVKREVERYRISLLRAGFPGSLFEHPVSPGAPSKQRQHPIQSFSLLFIVSCFSSPQSTQSNTEWIVFH